MLNFSGGSKMEEADLQAGVSLRLPLDSFFNFPQKFLYVQNTESTHNKFKFKNE